MGEEQSKRNCHPNRNHKVPERRKAGNFPGTTIGAATAILTASPNGIRLLVAAQAAGTPSKSAAIVPKTAKNIESPKLARKLLS